MMMKKAMLIVVAGVCLLGGSVKALAVNLRQCRIVTAKDDAPLVRKMAAVMSADIERVTGVAPDIDGSGIDGLDLVAYQLNLVLELLDLAVHLVDERAALL